MASPQLIEALYANQPLVAEIHAHNCRVIIARRRGEEAPPYRNALAEVEALCVAIQAEAA